MCKLVSGFIHKRTDEIVAPDMNSHSDTKRLVGWDSQEIQNWSEWEWPYGEDMPTVRVLYDDDHDAKYLRAAILGQYPTWDDMFAALARKAVYLDCYNTGITKLPDGMVNLMYLNCSNTGITIEDRRKALGGKASA